MALTVSRVLWVPGVPADEERGRHGSALIGAPRSPAASLPRPLCSPSCPHLASKSAISLPVALALSLPLSPFLSLSLSFTLSLPFSLSLCLSPSLPLCLSFFFFVCLSFFHRFLFIFFIYCFCDFSMTWEGVCLCANVCAVGFQQQSFK